MRTYEIMCVFAPQDEQFTEGLSLVKEQLTQVQATIQQEEDMGVREIAGMIKKHTHAHYLYFTATMMPDKVKALNTSLALIQPLLRVLIINKT